MRTCAHKHTDTHADNTLIDQQGIGLRWDFTGKQGLSRLAGPWDCDKDFGQWEVFDGI